jgi:hypothetical protein
VLATKFWGIDGWTDVFNRVFLSQKDVPKKISLEGMFFNDFNVNFLPFLPVKF